MSARPLVTCPRCQGALYDPEAAETKVDWECCGQYLPSGECCAAIYGTDRLVPVEYPIPVACQRCGGYGQVEDPEGQP